MFILTNRYSLKGEETKEFCVQNGITCFDINLNEKKDNLILGSMDGHWNSRANEDIFKEFLPGIKQLIEKKLVYHYTSN